MTEDEAKTKWCPFVREVGVAANGKQYTAGNRHIDFKSNATYGNPVGCRCIASECMAWRTDPMYRDRYMVTFNSKPEEEWHWNPTGHKGYESAKVRILRDASFGYCGLAGKP